MTTAHRPTWKAAIGHAQEGGWSVGGSANSPAHPLIRRVHDLASHTKLKLRKGAQLAGTNQRLALLAKSLAKMEEAKRSNIGRERLLKLEDGKAKKGARFVAQADGRWDDEKTRVLRGRDSLMIDTIIYLYYYNSDGRWETHYNMNKKLSTTNM